jgi:hypothetical protein
MTTGPQKPATPGHAPLTEAEARTGHDLLTMMGNTLATWQGVEHTIADIYLVFFRPRRADAAAVAFYSVRTFEARLGIVDALVTFFCSDAQKTTWGELYAAARKRSRKRNAVAHGLVGRHGKAPNTEFVVGKSIYDIADFPDPPLRNGFYTIKELQEMCTTFVAVTKQLDAFRHVLANDQGLRARLDAQKQQVLANEAIYPLKIQNPPPPQSPLESSQG